ncbi:MAG: hypothetical protein ACYTGW_07940 [Planctomycetota bacterium]|jgi:hypothetical protein
MSRLLNAILVPTLALALALVGCSKTKLPTTQLDPATLVATISHGETVDLEDHLVPGIWTLLEFTADW